MEIVNKIKVIRNGLLIVMGVALLSTCITEYHPKDIDEIRGLMVVEGVITNDTTTIILSKSVGILEDIKDIEMINHATVSVECDNGALFHPVNTIEDGVYKIPTGQLSLNQKYRLNIMANNQTYQSDYLAPINTPAIDSIGTIKKGEGQNVSICVNTHDDTNQSLYYSWSYKEHWEINADLYANAGYDEDGRIIEYTVTNNTYYCWDSSRSKQFLLASSDKLQENVIYQKKLIEWEPSNIRFSVLYYIYVEQNQIRKEAYDYYYNLQKNVEQTGSIFAPMPSELRGNIRNLTHADEPVIGYIDVSVTTHMERFIPRSEGFYESPRRFCTVLETKPDDPTYTIYEFAESAGIISWAPKSCVDCRVRGTKTKPGFWPNDHQ